MEYVAGFLFNTTLTRVVLIQKLRPKWQAGRLNGVGGKVEPGESPEQAMHREFREEAGLDNILWQKFAALSGPEWTVHMFTAHDSRAQLVRSVTDEFVGLYIAQQIPALETIRNLRWLVPLAQDFLRSEPGAPLFTATTYAT